MASFSAKSIFSNHHRTSFPTSSSSSYSRRCFLPPIQIEINSKINVPTKLYHRNYYLNCAQRIVVTNVLKTLDSPAQLVSDVGDRSPVSNKPRVLVSEKLGAAGLEVLRDFADVDCSYDLSQEELKAKISKGVEALIVRSGTKVTREVFEAGAGWLKVVGRAGVGIDNVDLQAATEYGCLVVNAPTANTIAAAEHGIALLAAMARNIAQSDASMKAGKLYCRILNSLANYCTS